MDRHNYNAIKSYKFFTQKFGYYGIKIKNFVKNQMDYQKLFSLIPKEPRTWNLEDLRIWLQFIGLPDLYPSFSIDKLFCIFRGPINRWILH